MKHAQSRVRNAHIVERASAGTSVAALAVEFGLTHSYIRLLLGKAGVKPPRHAPVPMAALSPHKISVLKRRAAIRELHALGLSGGRARALMQMNQSTFAVDARTLGLKFPYDREGKLADRASVSKGKAAQMAELYRAGCTLEVIGSQYGITRERVRQIMTKHLGVTGKDGGRHVQSVRSEAISQQRREQRSWAKHGCSYADYRALVALGKPTRAYASQKRNAIRRGISWEMNLWQWWTIWQQSGKWDQRGRRGDAFVMCRKNDLGGYSPDNVYIATLRHNSSVQPNNPYRSGHPDHDRVMATKARTTRPKRDCTVDGCAKPHYAHGYCNNHYYHFVTKARASSTERAAA